MDFAVRLSYVTVDQKLEDDETSVDSVARWETTTFKQYKVPRGLPFRSGTNEILRGSRKIISDQNIIFGVPMIWTN